MLPASPDAASPYQGYLYAYPHKSAYRPLRPRPPLRDVWADERRDALFLYLHVPFCEMRCGFCNLFTRANPPDDQVRLYLRQLRGQAAMVRAALGPAARFAAGAVGGGTPTYLTPAELDELFDIVDEMTGYPTPPLSVETSPATATPQRLAVLAARGATRVSIGVQSFLDAEAHAVGRPQRRSDVEGALLAIRAAAVHVLNVDLIYGIPGQSRATWAQSLRAALSWRPEEIYLYPLYVRPLTGLGRRSARLVADTESASLRADPSAQWDAQRLALYRQGRDTLGAAGYRQQSMRLFRRDGVSLPPTDYCCQDDGMVGLGCGARSYTRALHYSFDYAVSVTGVRAVLADYMARPATDFECAEVGFALGAAEQRRRWLVKTLLRIGGCDRVAWRARFGSEVVDDFPQLAELAERGWLEADSRTLRLSDEGLAHSDAVGAWLVSTDVRIAMREYELR